MSEANISALDPRPSTSSASSLAADDHWDLDLIPENRW